MWQGEYRSLQTRCPAKNCTVIKMTKIIDWQGPACKNQRLCRQPRAGTGPGGERFLDNQRFKGTIDRMLEDVMAIANSQTRNSTLVSLLEIEGTAENRHSRLPSLCASTLYRSKYQRYVANYASAEMSL